MNLITLCGERGETKFSTITYHFALGKETLQLKKPMLFSNVCL